MRIDGTPYLVYPYYVQGRLNSYFSYDIRNKIYHVLHKYGAVTYGEKYAQTLKK